MSSHESMERARKWLNERTKNIHSMIQCFVSESAPDSTKNDVASLAAEFDAVREEEHERLHPAIGHNDGPCCTVCSLEAERDAAQALAAALRLAVEALEDVSNSAGGISDDGHVVAITTTTVLAKIEALMATEEPAK